MKKLLVLPLFIFLCTPFWVAAQDYGTGEDDDVIENTIGFGPRVGYYHVDDLDDGNFYYGLQTRIRLSEVFGIEGSVSYRHGTDASFIDAGGVEQSFETKFVPVTGSLMLFIPIRSGLSPYGMGGIGAYYTIYDADGDFIDDWDNEFNIGYHLGFGIEFPFSDNVAFNVDYRYIFLTPENENTPEDADYSGNAFTGSLMFYF